MGKIKIGISGAHSTGKTTFIKKLASELTNRNVNFKIVTDLAIGCPLPILRNQTVESTLWIASKGIMQEIEAQYSCDVTIVDRSILDCWAYFNTICKNNYSESDPKLLTLKSMIGHWLSTYDLIYQTDIDDSIPIENKKGRDLDVAYRREVDIEFKKANQTFHLNPKMLNYQNSEEVFLEVLTAIQ